MFFSLKRSNKPYRRILFFISILLVILLFSGIVYYFYTSRPLCDKCNVILVSIDTLGSNHMPCYGYERNTSSNLCKFAEENVMFSNSFSNASWTLPSHFSIFTSLYPSHHGMNNYHDVLDDNIDTMPQIFNSNGYKTIYVGPTNDSALPLSKGLGRGFIDIQSYKINNIKSWEKGLDKLIDNNKKNIKTFLFLHTYWVHAIYLKESPSNKSTNRLYTDKYYPEIPLSNKHEFSDKFLDSLKTNSNISKNKLINNLIQANSKKRKEIIRLSRSKLIQPLRSLYYWAKLKDVDKSGEYAKALYDEGIFYLDKKIINLLNLVKSQQLKDNTILIITSDHGENFMEHGYLGHFRDALYNSVTSVPLIMYIPGVKNKRIDKMVEGVDILPTLLNLVGLKVPKLIDGIDLTGLIKNIPNAKVNKYVISQGANVNSISDGIWKNYEFLNNKINKIELYNLKSDPREILNVGEDNKSISNDLLKALNNIIYAN